MISGMFFNNERALKVAKELETGRREGRGIFVEGVRYPEDVLPENVQRGSREHALWLFYSAPLTPRAVSEEVYQTLRRMSKVSPELFDPAYVRDLSMNEFSKRAKPFLPHGDNDVVLWCENSLRLEKYGDDPVNICGNERDVVAAHKRLEEFRGYGPKVTPMLLGWYHKYGFSDFDNKYELRIPVDVWVIDLSIGQRVLEVYERKTRREKVEDFLREGYYDFFKRHVGIDSFEYQELLWNVGAYACNTGPCGKMCPLEEPCVATMVRDHYMNRAIVKLRRYRKTLQKKLF